MKIANNQYVPHIAALDELRRKKHPDPDLATVLALIPVDGRIELDDLLPCSPFDARKTYLLLGQLVCAKTVVLRKDHLVERTWLWRARDVNTKDP